MWKVGQANLEEKLQKTAFSAANPAINPAKCWPDWRPDSQGRKENFFEHSGQNPAENPALNPAKNWPDCKKKKKKYFCPESLHESLQFLAGLWTVTSVRWIRFTDSSQFFSLLLQPNSHTNTSNTYHSLKHHFSPFNLQITFTKSLSPIF